MASRERRTFRDIIDPPSKPQRGRDALLVFLGEIYLAYLRRGGTRADKTFRRVSSAIREQLFEPKQAGRPRGVRSIDPKETHLLSLAIDYAGFRKSEVLRKIGIDSPKSQDYHWLNRRLELARMIDKQSPSRAKYEAVFRRNKGQLRRVIKEILSDPHKPK